MNTSPALNAITDAYQGLNFSEATRPSASSLVDNQNWLSSLYVIDDKAHTAKPLQLLLPTNSIAELDKINQALGGDYRALNESEQRIHFGEHASPYMMLTLWEQFDCVVEESLLSRNELFIETSDTQAIKIDRNSFLSLTKACRTLSFASTAPQSALDASNDEEAVTQSVAQFTERRIQQRLDETLELPPLPRTSQRIIELRSKPDANVDELAEIVETDPALAAQIVSWAGSPYYRAPGEIKSVQDAIVRVLGFDMVLNLALGLSLGKNLLFKQISRSELQSFWRKSMLMAVTSESLVMGIPPEQRPDRGQAYLCGLLSQLGYLILAEVFPLYFQQIRRQHAVNRHQPRIRIEQSVLGISHNQIASCLLKNWQMSDTVIGAVRFSEQPSYQGEHQHISKLLMCAQHLLARYHLIESPGRDLTDDLLDALCIDPVFAVKKIEHIQEATANFEHGFIA